MCSEDWQCCRNEKSILLLVLSIAGWIAAKKSQWNAKTVERYSCCLRNSLTMEIMKQNYFGVGLFHYRWAVYAPHFWYCSQTQCFHLFPNEYSASKTFLLVVFVRPFYARSTMFICLVILLLQVTDRSKSIKIYCRVVGSTVCLLVLDENLHQNTKPVKVRM